MAALRWTGIVLLALVLSAVLGLALTAAMAGIEYLVLRRRRQA